MLSSIALDRGQCLQQQLFDQMRDLICSGRLQSGTRMPSTRMLAETFDVSRNTVILTYDRLIAEGFLETRPAQGTFVVGPHRLRPGLALVAGTEMPQPVVAPKIWRPDPGLFPLLRWRALMRAALDDLGSGAAPVHPAGEPALRRAIAGWLSASRNIAVCPEQIVLTQSRQHALHLVSRLVLVPGQAVVLESPCEKMTEAAYREASADLAYVCVDADGLQVEHLPQRPVGLLHVSPESQRPLGALLAAGRRTALLDWARHWGAVVLEDNSHGELHYGPRQATPLIAMDQDDRVIMLGSFAAPLGPWLQLAYLVLPRRLIPACAEICDVIGGTPSRLEQLALAELMAGGGYARHVYRLTKIYAARRDALVSALRRHFGGEPAIWGLHCGLHLTWFPPSDAGPSGYIAHAARQSGLEAQSLPAEQGRAHAGTQAVMLGFGTLSETQIEQRIHRLAEVLATNSEMALSAD